MMTMIRAGAGLHVQFDGLKELQAEFDRMFSDSNAHQPVLEKGAEYFRDVLEGTVYDYDFDKRSGKSEKSMAIQKSPVDNEIYIGVSRKSSDAFYLYYQEYGTSKIRARPFMRLAFEKELDKIIEIMAQEMRARMRL